MIKETVYYVMDPMCSWCWGFADNWQRLRQQLGDSDVVYVMGGLAPDSHEPMSEDMQAYLRQTWSIVSEKTGADFNHQFWEVNRPRRSTYPACRAVIATRMQAPARQEAMIRAIQEAYYLQARNPSDTAVLVDLAKALQLDAGRFAVDLESPQTDALLQQDLALKNRLGIRGFPSLVVKREGRSSLLASGYTPYDPLISRYRALSSN